MSLKELWDSVRRKKTTCAKIQARGRKAGLHQNKRFPDEERQETRLEKEFGATDYRSPYT